MRSPSGVPASPAMCMALPGPISGLQTAVVATAAAADLVGNVQHCWA